MIVEIDNKHDMGKVEGKASVIQQPASYSISNKNFMFMIFLASCIFLGIFYYQPHIIVSQSILLLQNDENVVYHPGSGGQFLIYNQKCRMPELDPMNEEVRLLYKKEKYTKCSTKPLLTYVKKDGNFKAKLFINTNVTKSYSTSKRIQCCYANVTRGNSSKDPLPDTHIRISNCTNWSNNVTLSHLPVKVSCIDTKTKKELYSNVHAAIVPTINVTAKIVAFHDTPPEQQLLSVLIIGVDSISRLNMMRVLPNTREYLLNTNWLEMKTFNKIGDNTFPNLMAILTGKNESHAYDVCNPKSIGNLDKCNFIWKNYSDFGYITGYAEDTASISTFNYVKQGFLEEPVDYYYRSYMMAAEKLKVKKVAGLNYCAGPETEGERILNLAKDFAITFKDLPSFGFFWMNSFSHGDVNTPSRFDDVIVKFLRALKTNDILKNSAVVFISDHGIRFGEIRYTRTGWLEERLPYLWLWLPSWFKQQHPESYQNLQTNSERLTTPYDLHMTLQDLLIHSGHNYTMQPSSGCPNCQTLFQPVPVERSCEDAKIGMHWCTCTGYKYINPSNATVQAASEFIVHNIHDLINKKKEGNKCSKLRVKRIMSSSLSANYDNWYKNSSYLLLVLQTNPQAIFEATVSVEDIADENTTFELQGGISRLDLYMPHASCVHDEYLKKHCYCK